MAVCLTLVLVAMVHVAMGKGAGMRLSVSAATLKHINSALLTEEWNSLRGKRFPDQHGDNDGVEYGFSNIRVSELGPLATDPVLSDGGVLRWTGHTGHIRVDADWRAKKEVKVVVKFDIAGDGDIELKADGTHVSAAIFISYVGGKPVLRLDQCSTTFQGFRPHIGSSNEITKLVGSIAERIFKNDIRRWLERELCNLVERSLNRLTEDLKTTELTYKIKMAGVEVTLDNSFTDVVLNADRLTTYHAASLSFESQPSQVQTEHGNPLPSLETEGITFDIREDTINEILRVMTGKRALDGKISLSETGSDAEVLVRFLLSEGNRKRTDVKLGVRWQVRQAKVEAIHDKISINLAGKLAFTSTRNDGTSDNMLSGAFEFQIPYQVKFSEYKIIGRPTGLRGKLVVESYNMGKFEAHVLESKLQFAKLMIPETMMEKAKTEYDIKRPRNVSFKDSRIQLYPGVIRLQTSVGYREGGVGLSPGNWVGEDLGITDSVITVEDAIGGARAKHDEF